MTNTNNIIYFLLECINNKNNIHIFNILLHFSFFIYNKNNIILCLLILQKNQMLLVI